MPKYEVSSIIYYLDSGNWLECEGSYWASTVEATTPYQAAIRYAVRIDFAEEESESGDYKSVVTVHTRRGERVFEFVHTEIRRLQRRLGVRVSRSGRS